MMKKRIAIIGHFGGNKEFLDGQTIKTKILYEELRNAVDWDIVCIDTYNKKEKPIKLLIQTIVSLLKRKRIVVLLSGNGMKFFFPILYFFAKYWKVKVYHDVIGGNLDRYVDRIPKFQKYLSSFEINWVETLGLKERLAAQGIKNCSVLPNFKRLRIVEDSKYIFPETGVFRFCTFSRVMREKGIEEAIIAIETINKELGEQKCSLDIFGAVSEEYREEFNRLMASASNSIHYCGTVPYSQSVDVIKNYYALLFPTFWDGEGFPGTIIDAYASGVPVIATDWNCNSELVIHNETGILYSVDDEKGLYSAIKEAIANSAHFMKFREKCARAASRYMPEAYIEKVIDELSYE